MENPGSFNKTVHFEPVSNIKVQTIKFKLRTHLWLQHMRIILKIQIKKVDLSNQPQLLLHT